MKKLYFHIYLYFLIIIVTLGVITAVGWLAHAHDRDYRNRLDAMGRLVAKSLPQDAAALPGALRELAEEFRVDLALYRADRTLVAWSGTRIPSAPEPGQAQSGWHHGQGGHVLLFRFGDGRWLSTHVPWRPPGYWMELLAGLVIVVAIGAWPLARGITRRLERLQKRVDALGAGDLGARVEVEGWDEIAALANSFNRAAERIESLVSVQRTLLASASHELRSPLARLRVAIELYANDPRSEMRDRIERDIVELDGLIDELLLASRLQTTQVLEVAGPVDLLALTAEEGAKVGATVTGDAAGVDGDRRLLRHLVRNLLENAQRHGAGTEIEATVTTTGSGVLLRVCDGGPGVPPGEGDRIFDPFYRAGAARNTRDGVGVGLGLHLVRVIAERHGATTGHRPNAPTGACFEILFPPPGSSPQS